MFGNQQGERGGTFALSKAGLAEGTNAATIKTAAPNGAGTDYAINGYLYHKADTDNIAMNALAVQAADTTCLYAVQIDASGAVTLKKGVEVLSIDLANGVKAVHFPEGDADRCVLGYIKIVTDGVTFTCGTTDLGAANITDTYYDTLAGPVRPLTS